MSKTRDPYAGGVLFASDDLSATLDCLGTLEQGTPKNSLSLLIAGTGPDRHAKKVLKAVAKAGNDISVSTQWPRIEDLFPEYPYLVLVDGNALLPPGWLDRLVRHLEMDSRNTAVIPAGGPPRPIPGANPFGIDRWISKNRATQSINLHCHPANPGCLLIARSRVAPELWNRISTPNIREVCRILLQAGARVVSAKDIYVYTGPVNNRFNRAGKKAWKHPIGIQAAKNRIARVTNAFRTQGTYAGLTEGLNAAWDLSLRRRWHVEPRLLAKATRPGALRVTYLLWNLDLTGGCMSVVQLVNALIRLGCDARIATLDDRPGLPGLRLLSEPMVFSTERDLILNLPETDIVVATLWHTAPWVPQILSRQLNAVGAYFVQDYEAWFYPGDDIETRKRVISTYSIVQHHIVKSDWLAAKLSEHGVRTYKIPLGLDVARFYPRNKKLLGKPCVLAMARPSTPRRGFHTMAQAFQKVQELRPDVEFTTFGEPEPKSGAGFKGRFLGRITSQDRLAELYSAATIFVDASDFQAFGRPGLEAMACATPCILTPVGGVTEYAKPGVNCKAVAPGDAPGLAGAVLELLDDPDQRKKLARAGPVTAKRFALDKEAKRTLRFFERISRGKP
ncbi:MAG: glycosyltransferase family 4 protein [Deltaproteobacteria bacterium]|nr:glycosyltransferase family 4 protein [Deltaproteobacteria bacterium]